MKIDFVTDGYMDGPTDGQTDGRMDGQTDQPTDRIVAYGVACPQLKKACAAIDISTENITMALIINLWKFLLTFSEILVICCNLLQNHSKIAATHSNLIDVDIIQHCSVRCSSKSLTSK